MSNVRRLVMAAAVAALLSPFATRHLRADGDTAPATAESTRKMAALLRERAALVDPTKVGFPMNDLRADLLIEELRHIPLSMKRLNVQFLLATELLYAGRADDCLKVLDAGESDAAKLMTPEGAEGGRINLLMLRASAYMRMAEDQNCCQRNNHQSCLMPIRGEGIHQNREAGLHAVETLKEILKRDPTNLQARWLLNLAEMTLGDYPQAVPKEQLIPP